MQEPDVYDGPDALDRKHQPAMSVLRRNFVPGLLLLSAAFVCGKLLLTPIQRPDSFFGAPCDDDFDTGWPWSFMQSAPFWNAQLHVTQPAACVEFSAWTLAADVAIVLLVIVLAALLIWRWGPKRFSPRFSLRGLLLLVVMAAACCAWWNAQKITYQQEQELVKRLLPDEICCDTACCAPPWLQKLWPTSMPQFFNRVVSVMCVDWSDKIIDSEKCGPLLQAAVPHFPRAKAIVLDAKILPYLSDSAAFAAMETMELRNADLQFNFSELLSGWSGLRHVILSMSSLHKAQELSPLGRLTQLETLEIEGSITDDVVEALVRFPALESLTILYPKKLTDLGVQRLLDVPTLKHVDINDVLISEATCKLLAAHFESVWIDGKQLPK